jgi:hypothetical protein
MIVVAVGIVEGNDDRHALPLLYPFECIDRVDQEHLLVERIRDPTGMASLIALGLDIAQGGQIVGVGRGEQIVHVVFVIGRTGMADLGDIERPNMIEVAGTRIVLKRRILTVIVVYDQARYRI